MLRSIVKQSGESVVNSNRITLDRSPDQGTDAAGGRGEMSGCVSPVLMRPSVTDLYLLLLLLLLQPLPDKPAQRISSQRITL